jgi:hypothetical protein
VISLPHVLGLDPGYWNMFWSGFGANFGEFAILGGLFAHYKRSTCHVDSPKFCWRPGVHPVAGTPYRTCKRHHPAVPDRVTAAAVVEAHTRSET